MTDNLDRVTREMFVLDSFRGTVTFTGVEQFALTIVQGAGFNLATASFEAKAHVLTDGTSPAVDLTDLCKSAALDCHKECLASSPGSSIRSIRTRHVADLVTAIREFREGLS